MITEDFDASEFIKFLQSDVTDEKKLSGIVAMTITIAEAFSKRGEISKYAIFEGVAAYMMLHIAVEVKKEIALQAIQGMTQMINQNIPNTKH